MVRIADKFGQAGSWVVCGSKIKTFSVALVVALKKNQDFLPFFQTLPPFSRLFPGLKNCWTNFKTFSRIQDSVRTLVVR